MSNAPTTSAIRSTENGKQIVTITRGDSVIVRKGKAEVRKPFASTCVDSSGTTHAFISVNTGEEFDWATGWEHVEIAGEPVRG